MTIPRPRPLFVAVGTLAAVLAVTSAPPLNAPGAGSERVVRAEVRLAGSVHNSAFVTGRYPPPPPKRN